jgi:hypothetical protein
MHREYLEILEKRQNVVFIESYQAEHATIKSYQWPETTYKYLVKQTNEACHPRLVIIKMSFCCSLHKFLEEALQIALCGKARQVSTKTRDGNSGPPGFN